MHREVGIFVGYLQKDIPHLNLHIQLFPALPDQSLLLAFPRFGLSAYKLPQKSPGLVLRPLADEKPVAFPDERCHHLCHVVLLSFYQKGLPGLQEALFATYLPSCLFFSADPATAWIQALRRPPSSSLETPTMVEPPGEQTASFSAPGC